MALKDDTLGTVIGILIMLILATGYVFNLVAIFNLPAVSLWTGFDILRVIGVFIPPLGALLGYF